MQHIMDDSRRHQAAGELTVDVPLLTCCRPSSARVCADDVPADGPPHLRCRPWF
jgi:hypothetical protein